MRRFLDDIKTDINNKVGLGLNLTGEDAKAFLIDMVDSLTQDEAGIYGTVNTDLNLTTTFQSIRAGFTAQEGSDNDFLKPDETTGEIKTSATAGYTYNITARVAFEVSNNKDYEFCILRDGLPVGFVDRITGAGHNDFATANLGYVEISAPAGAVYTIGARVIETTDVLTINQVILGAEIVPTENP